MHRNTKFRACVFRDFGCLFKDDRFRPVGLGYVTTACLGMTATTYIQDRTARESVSPACEVGPRSRSKWHANPHGKERWAHKRWFHSTECHSGSDVAWKPGYGEEGILVSGGGILRNNPKLDIPQSFTPAFFCVSHRCSVSSKEK